ncbi:hypothetical protein ES705_17068 [subsurface metagenome]
MKILEEASQIVNGVKFYNTDKVSKILKTSRITVARYFKEGRFPPVKFAGKYHMSQEDLLAYISTGAIIKPIPFSKFMTYKEIKQFDSNILRATKKKLKMIEEVIERNKIKVKMIGDPRAKIALENYILRYKKIKKDIEMAEKEPISSDDIF